MDQHVAPEGLWQQLEVGEDFEMVGGFSGGGLGVFGTDGLTPVGKCLAQVAERLTSIDGALAPVGASSAKGTKCSMRSGVCRLSFVFRWRRYPPCPTNAVSNEHFHSDRIF